MNYFGAMRSAGFTAVSSNVFNSLLMSRQRACLDNKPVCFYLSDATNYVLQEAFGEISDIKPDGEAPVAGSLIFYVQYCDLSGFKSNTVLLNMDQPNVTARAWADAGPVTYDVSSVNPDDPDGNLVSYPALAYQIRVSPPNGTWNIGDRFGMELFSPQKLPKGFHFVPAPIAPLNKIVFNPDGTVDTDPAHGISSLVVKEKISDNQVSFTIDPNGKITQGN